MMQIIKQKHAYKNSYLLTFEKKKTLSDNTTTQL